MTETRFYDYIKLWLFCIPRTSCMNHIVLHITPVGIITDSVNLLLRESAFRITIIFYTVRQIFQAFRRINSTKCATVFWGVSHHFRIFSFTHPPQGSFVMNSQQLCCCSGWDFLHLIHIFQLIEIVRPLFCRSTKLHTLCPGSSNPFPLPLVVELPFRLRGIWSRCPEW